MSSEQDELRRLIEELPDEWVPAVLVEARGQDRQRTRAAWRSAWFSSFTSGRRDLASDYEDLLTDGFGRS